MVDINTALAAAATERKNRGAGQKDRKKNRSGADLGIESFDPVKHVAKERADTVSMWLVLAFGFTIALLMRYLAMPSSQDSPDLLWFLPMMCIFLLPSIHRAVLPEKFVEHYTKGTWFKASFLHIFTWLALTFILTNAPFADIVAPQVDSGWGMISENDEGFDFEKSKANEITILANYTGTHYLVLSFSDNVLASGATYTITADWSEDNLVNSWTNISAVDSNALDDVRTHKSIDYPVAVAIPESLEVGTYVVDIEVVEEGDPWTNTRTVSMKLVVEEVPELSE
ncbi:MAG: hypothetical protein ACPHDO_03090 [Candidatus Poseidoniaceae archaeon]|jgi:hypothetical protein